MNAGTATGGMGGVGSKPSPRSVPPSNGIPAIGGTAGTKFDGREVIKGGANWFVGGTNFLGRFDLPRATQ